MRLAKKSAALAVVFALLLSMVAMMGMVGASAEEAAPVGSIAQAKSDGSVAVTFTASEKFAPLQGMHIAGKETYSDTKGVRVITDVTSLAGTKGVEYYLYAAAAHGFETKFDTFVTLDNGVIFQIGTSSVMRGRVTRMTALFANASYKSGADDTVEWDDSMIEKIKKVSVQSTIWNPEGGEIICDMDMSDIYALDTMPAIPTVEKPSRTPEETKGLVASFADTKGIVSAMRNAWTIPATFETTDYFTPVNGLNINAAAPFDGVRNAWQETSVYISEFEDLSYYDGLEFYAILDKKDHSFNPNIKVRLQIGSRIWDTEGASLMKGEVVKCRISFADLKTSIDPIDFDRAMLKDVTDISIYFGVWTDSTEDTRIVKATISDLYGYTAETSYLPTDCQNAPDVAEEVVDKELAEKVKAAYDALPGKNWEIEEYTLEDFNKISEFMELFTMANDVTVDYIVDTYNISWDDYDLYYDLAEQIEANLMGGGDNSGDNTDPGDNSNGSGDDNNGDGTNPSTGMETPAAMLGLLLTAGAAVVMTRKK